MFFICFHQYSFFFLALHHLFYNYVLETNGHLANLHGIIFFFIIQISDPRFIYF